MASLDQADIEDRFRALKDLSNFETETKGN